MCEALEILINKGKEEAKKEGKEEAKEKARKETRKEDLLIAVRRFLKFGFPKDTIIRCMAEDYNVPASECEELYQQAVASLDA